MTFKQLHALIASVVEIFEGPVVAEAARSESEDVKAAAARLESALERIARHAGRAADRAAPDPRLAEISTRLERLIATLRRALAGEG